MVDPGEDCDQFAPEGQQCGRTGTPVACRFECSQSPEEGSPICPSGWQCGTDDICRAATGTFAAAGVPIEAAVERVLLGDFQGNGRASVLGLGGANNIGAAYTRLFFLDDDGTAVESNLLGFPVMSPQLRDLSGDGRDDFVFSLGGGLGMLLGQSRQELLPVAYPMLTLEQGASTLAIPIHPQPRSILDQLLVIFVSIDGQSGLQALDDEVAIAVLPHPHDQLANEPVVADVIRDASAPCGEMLFAYKDEPEIWLVQPCNGDGTWAGPATSLRLAATLPDDFVVDTGAFLADVDGDDELDLIVGADTGKTFVAQGCGGGLFCADKDDDSTQGRLLPVEPWSGSECSDLPMAAPESPIAVGDVNGDGLPDVVTPSEVLVVHSVVFETTKARVEVCPAATKLVGRWTTAKIADLTLDGRPDIVAGSSNGLDLEFYAGTGFDRLNLTRITTPAPVKKMSIGDFDGDLVPDLAVGLSGAIEGSEGAGPDTLAIAYGRVQQPPEPLVPLAAFNGIDQIVAAHFDFSDAVEELGVVAHSDEGLQTVTVFLSSGGRQLLAPFGLIGAPAGPTPEADVEGSPLSLALGDFTGDGNLDIASFAIDNNNCTSELCRFQLWVTPSAGNAELLPSAYGPQLPLEVQPYVFSPSLGVEIAVFPFAADVDGDGRQDVALLAPWGPDTEQAAVWWSKLDDSARSLSAAQTVTRGPLRLYAKSYPVVTDLDGDGQLDVVALSAEPEGPRLVVAWGSTGIDLTDPRPIYLPLVPSGFSLINADTDDLRELIVVGTEGVYLVQRSPSDPRAWEQELVEGVIGGSSVAVRDIDGDGIEDLAVADELGVRIYRGKAALP